MEFFVFNPEHDYALADGNASYMAMRSAANFSHDCAPFLNCLFHDCHVHNLYVRDDGEYVRNCKIGCDVDDIDSVTAWGWDRAVRQNLLNAGMPERLLPSVEEVDKIRELAHRKTAVRALEFIRANSGFKTMFPVPAQILTSPEEVVSFIQNNPHVMLKSPYSGNGRGHLHAHGECSPTLLRQATGVIAKQGAILAEQHLNVVQDFAMEFRICNGNAIFDGLSLFRTRGYAYDSNFLIPDDRIWDVICGYVRQEVLENVQGLVADFLKTEIAPYYNGVAGVDMFVYGENGDFKIQPFSEVNLRYTMGAAAHSIFKNCCHNSASGTFRIVRSDKDGELKSFVESQSLARPLKSKDGRWLSGFTALNPVDDFTKYAVCVTLD